MKVKGLRWVVIGLIMLITIINYLDRGTLNYMWVANIDYRLLPEAEALSDKGNHAALVGDQYILTAANGNRDSVSVANVQMKEKNGVTFVTNREGIAIDLGLIDRNDPDASQKAKDILGLITIFFMIAYGISQLVSGKLYDKIGCRKGFFWSVLVWGAADALASLSRGIFSLTFFRMMLGLGEAGPWPGTTKSNAEWFPQKERAFAQGLFGAAASIGSILAPIIILMLFIAFGWKLTFIVVGGLGLIWLIPWLIINKATPKEHPWITEEERTYILSGQPEKEIKTEDKGKSLGRTAACEKELVCHSRPILPRPYLVDVCNFPAALPCRRIPSEYKRGGVLCLGTLCGRGFGKCCRGLVFRLADKPWKDCELCPQSSHADWWIYNYSVHSGSYHVYHGSGCHSLYGTGIGRLPVLHDELADHSERFA